jgi:superoxide dismutase, Cu-Zn family
VASRQSALTAIWVKLVLRGFNMRGFERATRVRLRLFVDVLAIGVAMSATTLALTLVLAAWAPRASAQDAQRVFITIAPVTQVAPDAKTQLPVQIGPQGVVLRNSFLRVRGLPPSAALSDGYAVTAGSWSVPLVAARSLAIIVPAGTNGTSELAIDLVNTDGDVLAQAKAMLVIGSGSAENSQHRRLETGSILRPDVDPSPLAAIQKGFDAFLAKTSKKGDATSALTADQNADMFRQFLTWAQNPLQVDVNVRLTSMKGVGELIGTLTVGNTEIMVAGRKEAALFIKPNLKGLRPGSYALNIHEHASCDSAVKDGEHVPGLGAGQQMWLSGTGQLSGTVFASHLGNLPRLEADANGTVTKAVVAARLTLADVANRSLVIHASQDDHSERLACGRLN